MLMPGPYLVSRNKQPGSPRSTIPASGEQLMSTQEHVQDHADQQAEGTRRSFLKSAALASAVPAIMTTPRGSNIFEISRGEEFSESRPPGPNDRIRIATIGMGIIGFIDTKTAPQGTGNRAGRCCGPLRGPARSRPGGLRRPGQRSCRLPRDPGSPGRRCRLDLRARPLAFADLDRRDEGRQGGLLREADGPADPGGNRGDRRGEGDRGDLPGWQPVRQLLDLREGPRADQGRRHRPRSIRSKPDTIATRRSGPGNTPSRPTPRPGRSTGIGSWARLPNARSTPSVSSAGAITTTTEPRSRETCSSTC